MEIFFTNSDQGKNLTPTMNYTKQNIQKKSHNFFAIFTVSRNFIATNMLKTSQLTSQFFRKAAANSGILGRNNLEKSPRNPGGTECLLQKC